ncbi:MAG: hypothetical protein A2Y62_05135 [Candidatus Fischerbacteria bacterium RBG_13_37_8]|uniref:Uncharacterized protein n=1 Tax=Candidatus Fischerbacteria bacterium RBG_13_37_8 TaxID=1817863 RepID=A0A1F5V8I3_9BACT|nr:MAG: hypothetical protein A2Y62_05135 [Candidatus Fischerbacteria bacterium RBG_13_37_8]
MKNWFSIDLSEDKTNELETKIQQQINERISNKQFTQQDIADLENMKLDVLPDPRQIQPFLLKEILPDSSLFYNNDYNLTPELIWQSSTSPFLSKVRKKLQPIHKLFANLEAVIHKQAMYNEKQVEFNTHIVHHVRLLHNIINYLITELTKLNLEHQQLHYYVNSIESQLNFFKEYQKALDNMLQENKIPHEK